MKTFIQNKDSSFYIKLHNMDFLYKGFGLITPLMETNGYKLKNKKKILSYSSQSFYNLLEEIQNGYINPYIFSTETLLNCLQTMFEYSNYHREDMRFLSRFEIEEKICEMVVRETAECNYDVECNPITYLMSGIVTKENYELLSKDDLNNFINAYGSTFSDIINGQDKMISNLISCNLNKTFEIRGTDIVKQLKWNK